MSTYNYSKASDFGGNLNTTQLHSEITTQQGSFTPVFQGINTNGDSVEIAFDSILSGAEEITLDGIVSSHIAVFPLGKGSLYFQGYSTTQTSVTTTWTDLPIETEVVKDSIFTHTTNSPEVIINANGSFVINVDANIIATGGGRSNVAIRLMVDTGSGYTEVPGTRRWIYLRQNNYGGSCSITRYIDLTSGDKFKVQADLTVGNAVSVVLADGFQFFVKNA